MIGASIMRLIPADRQDEEIQILTKIKHGESVEHFETLRQAKDGQMIAVSVTASPIKDASGKVVGVSKVARDITERLEAEEALRKGEERFRSYFELGQIGMAITSSTKGCLEVNDKMCQILGYERSELLQMTWAEMTHPDDLAADDDNFNRVLAGECDGYSMNKRFVRKDGQVVDSAISVKCLRRDDGSIDYFVAMLQDVTAQHRAEEELRESEAKFRALFDAANDAIFLLHNGVFADCNASGLKLYGVTRDQLIGQSPALISPPTQPDGRDSQEKALEIIQRAMTGEPQLFEWVHQKSDGTPIHVDVSVSRFELRGEPYLQAIARDSTERKRAENEKERVGRQMRLLLESAVEGIYGVDLEGRFTFINRAATEMLGCKAEQALGRVMHDFKHHHRKDGSVYPIEECPIFRVLQNHEGCTVNDEVFWRSDGTSFPVEYSVQPIFEGTAVTGAVVTFTDITERKKAEEILLSASKTEKGQRTKNVFKDMGVIVVLSVLVFVTCRQLGLSNESFQYIASQDEGAASFLDEAIFTLMFFCLAMLVFSYRRWKESQAETVSQTQVAKALSLLHGEMETRVQQRTAELVTANEALQTEMVEGKRGEEQIAEQAALLDKARDSILVRDLEGKILFWNKGSERMYGWTRQEAVGRNIGELLYPNPKKFEEIKGQTISQDEWHGELQQLTKDRQELTVEARWTLIRDNEGHPKSVLSINTDITEKKKIEAQFMRAQRMESIGTLAGGIAHDLNNILAPIMMSIDILKTMSDNPQAMKILETIEVSAKRGADIVRQVLSFARGMEGERIEIQPKHLLKDLESIIKDTFPKDIRLQFSVPNDTWTILGDPTQVHQILLNLCVNARDAMPNGGNLTIRVENSRA